MLHQSLPPEDAKSRRSVANALTGAERAAALTQRLLAFSRRQPLEPKPVDINRLIGDMTDLLRRTLGETIKVRTDLELDIPTALADVNQLENALLNLAINARDAMPEGGHLEVATGVVEVDEASANEAKLAPGTYVRIAVKDDGIGMSPEVVKRAVEPFFTTKEVGQGTGLGLSMVYGFARQSGGDLSLRSVEGQGTTIELFLPRSTAAAQVNAASGPSMLPRGRGEVILVCEDDADVRQFSIETLAELGYQVVEARDADAALAKLAGPDRVDLLFTDVVLPGGKTGADLAREARELRPGLSILLTSGYARSALDDVDVSPAFEMIAKPFSVERLAQRLRHMLD
jgi:CheY-like chemotaxis protein